MVSDMKRLLAFLLIFAVSLPGLNVFGASFTDQFIETESVDRLFTGRPEAQDMRFNLSFDDMSGHIWAIEPVARTGALGLIVGRENRFHPGASVTRADAISHIMRALGYENAVLAQTVGMAAQLPPGTPMSMLLELSYLFFASSLNIITAQQYNDALFDVRERRTIYNTLGAGAAAAFTLPAYMFDMQRPVTREELAGWIYRGLQTIDGSLWVSPASTQSLYRYSDWWYIAPENLLAVEAMLSNDIMAGYMGLFMPRETVTRAVLAAILRSMSDIYGSIVGIERNTGIVAGIVEIERSETPAFTVIRDVFIRTSQGGVDVLRFEGTVNVDNISTLDAVVFKNWEVVGLQNLMEGDVVEYLVNNATGQVLYVQVLGVGTTTEVDGVLHDIDFAANTVTLRQIDGNLHIYTVAGGMTPRADDGTPYLVMHGLSGNIDGDLIPMAYIPFSSRVRLTLLGNVAVSMHYLGAPITIEEGSGIVLENNPVFGYMTILETGGNVIALQYFENDMIVRRRDHFETEGISYLAGIFPFFGFDPLLTTIDRVLPGDLVFFRTFDDAPDVISEISSVANYTIRHGRILSIVQRMGYVQILVEYENTMTAMFSVANSIFVTQDGQISSVFNLNVGDWVRLLVNFAVVAPGVFIETVREINVQGPERHIGTLVRGQLIDIDSLQWNMRVEDVFTLNPHLGWINHRNVENFDLSGRDILYFHNNVQISRDQAHHFLRRSGYTVYIGLESHFLGDRVRMVSFRNSRDDFMVPDTVVWSNNVGSFELASLSGSIIADEGTIVVRYGRLVSQGDINTGDFVNVVLNGPGQAAIVYVTSPPDVSGLMFARLSVQNVNLVGSRFFTTNSGVSELIGTTWMWAAGGGSMNIGIDHNTIFWDYENGFINFEQFISFNNYFTDDESVIGNIFTVVIEGARASFVIQQPYWATAALRGTIYGIEGDLIGIRNAQWLNSATGIWTNISTFADNTLLISVPEYALIAQDNTIIAPDYLAPLVIGSNIVIMTPPYDTPPSPGDTLPGYIIRVVP